MEHAVLMPGGSCRTFGFPFSLPRCPIASVRCTATAPGRLLLTLRNPKPDVAYTRQCCWGAKDNRKPVGVQTSCIGVAGLPTRTSQVPTASVCLPALHVRDLC